MKLSDEVIKKLIPLGDKFLFRWIKPTPKPGAIILPDSVYQPDLRIGRWYNIEILRVGPGCRLIKPGEFAIFNEYSRLVDVDEWKENEVYFGEEKEIRALVTKEYIDQQSVVQQAGIITEDPRAIKKLESQATIKKEETRVPVKPSDLIGPDVAHKG